MLLAKIKEALNSLYEDIQEAEEVPDAAAAVDTTAADAAATAAAEEVQAEETDSEQEESKVEEAEEPEEPAPPPGPKETDYMAKGYHLDVELPPEKIPEAAEILLRESFFIESITGVDWIDDGLTERIQKYRQFHISTRGRTGTNGKPMIFSA
jgi:hypothetical protein